MTYSMLLIRRNGIPDNAERFLYIHAEQCGFKREQVKVYRYYYRLEFADSVDDSNILNGITDDTHASHFLYVLDFVNEKDRFLYTLRCDTNSVDLFYKYGEWNDNELRETWKNSMQELLNDGYFSGEQ